MSIAFSQNRVIDSLQRVLEFQKHDSTTADAFLMVGVLSLPNYPEALKNYYSALKLYEKLGDKNSIAKALQYIGAANKSQGNDDEALKNYLASLEIRKIIGDKGNIATSYNSIGAIYTNKGDYAKSLELHFSALKIYQELGDNAPGWGLAWSNLCIGNVYKKEGEMAIVQGYQTTATNKFAQAHEKYLEALKGYEKTDDKGGLLKVYELLGDLSIKLKKISKAQDYFKKSLEISKVTRYKDIKNVYQGLSLIDSIQGNYKQALYHYKLAIFYRDYILNDENTKKSLMYKMQYEFEKKEALAKVEQEKKDIQEKRRKNEQYFIMFSLLLLLLFCLLIAFIQWRNNRQKQKTNVLLQQQNEKIGQTLTKLQSTQTQLIQSEKLASLGELTAGIAHEIQNPLNFVNNFSELSVDLAKDIKEEMHKPAVDQAYLDELLNDLEQNQEKINLHGKRAAAIVNGMLQHARTSTGKKEPTDLNALADEYRRLSYHGLRAKDSNFNAKMVTDFDPAVGKVDVIPQDMGRVFLNLVNNAFYAVVQRERQLPESLKLSGSYVPTVSISTQKTDNQIIIKIKDNGTGIPDDVKAKIFQPFFTTKPTGQGTGLGLSLAYDIVVKGHGGTVEVFSTEDTGTEFVIKLPV